MNDEDFANLVESIKQAGQIKKGLLEPTPIFEFNPLDIKAIRQKLQQLETCPGCQANLPKINAPTHRYIGASPSCWQIYSALNVGEPPLARDIATSLLVDAYAAQHPGTPNPQAIRSVAVHLLTLYGILVKDVVYQNAIWIRRRALRSQNHAKPTHYHWLTPPSFSGTITVADIGQTLTPAARTQKTKQYIDEVLQTWSDTHLSTISDWYERFVLSD